jgi:transposase
MRGSDERSGSLFSYVDLEARVRADHPLRVIRSLANAALVDLSVEFDKLYTDFGRLSIAPEKLLRAMLLQVFYGVRSERHLMERMEFDLLFGWFVGLGWMTRFGTIRPSRRTATGCLRAILRPSS